MGIEHNIILLRKLLELRGWIFYDESSQFWSLSNSFLFKEEIVVRLPIDTTIDDFPSQLIASLTRIIQTEPGLAKNLIIKKLVAQGKNIRQKYLKDKNQWILREPNSKYIAHEIPDLYIPKI